MKNYNDVLLNEIDFNVIKSLEVIVGRIIPYNDYEYIDSYSNKFGFKAINGNIVILSVASKNFKTFPTEILDLKDLELLDWSCMKDSIKDYEYSITIPEDISSLKKLKNLSLCSNGLETLPEALFNLKDLISLNLELNKLRFIPNSIKNLKNLKYLFLSNNQLKDFPDSILELKNLELLDLNSNYIDVIPENIDRLKCLKDLRIALTDNTNLPLSLINLKNLKYLYINYNPPYYSKEELIILQKLEKRGVELGDIKINSDII